MRTVTFKHLYDRIVRRAGLDPLTDIGQAEARALVDCINLRIAHIWPLTPFPELMRTQERGFRPIWDSHAQYRQQNLNTNVLADEVMWTNNAGNTWVYYQAKSPPGWGTTDPTGFRPNPNPPPANLLGIAPPLETWDPLNPPPPPHPIPAVHSYHWIVIDTPTAYLDFDVPGLLPPIGTAYGVYSTNPSGNNTQNVQGDVTKTFDALRFQPSQAGVRVIGSHNNTVFVWFQIAAPQYSIVPYIRENKGYVIGDRVYNPDDGRVYRCVSPQATGPMNLGFWREEIVPDFFQGYLIAGSCADYLKNGPANDPAVQAKLASAQVCETEATEKYQALVDRLGIHGYKPKLQWPSMGCQQWMGDFVEPLYLVFFIPPIITDEPVTPSSPLIPGVSWEYHPEIEYKKTSDGVPSVSGLSTTTRDFQSIAEVVIDGIHIIFQLVTGAADSGDPGQVAPDDYASVSNDKHWNQVS
jgi:hypothetical protein